MNPALQAAAMVLVAGGILCTATIALTTGRWREAAGAGLELWLAAGLLRLSGTPSWQRIGAAAAIVLIRRLVRTGLLTADMEPAGAVKNHEPAGLRR